MAEQPQTIINNPVSPNKPVGARNQINLKASFPSSPIHTGEISDEERKKFYQENVLDGSVSNGLGIMSFDRDYSSNNPPNLPDVDTGGGGLPATPYVPNLTSPGPGSVNAGDQAPYEGEIPPGTPEFGTGLGSTTSPSETSANIDRQKLGSYITGRSYKGSDGRS